MMYINISENKHKSMEVRTAYPKNQQPASSAKVPVEAPPSSDSASKADLFIQTDIPERVLKSLKDRLVPEEGELQKEAEWIHRSMQEILGQRQLPSIDSICRLLECYRVEHFDVPYIYAYRTDLYDELDREMTWEIFRLERSWSEFYQRKKSLVQQTKDMVSKLGRFDHMLELAQCAANTFELDDVEKFLSFCQAIVAATSLTKESLTAPLPGLNERQQEVARERVMKLHEFAERFSLSAEEFCANLRSNKKEKQPPHIVVRAYTLAKDYICAPKLAEEHLVVVEASHYIAAEIAATQPLLRKKVREYMLKYGELTTVPTVKGNTELDVFSPSYRVKRISHRPLETLLDDIWLDIQQREKDGLITVNISLDPHKQTELTNQLQCLFALTDDEVSQISEKEQHYETEYNNLLKDGFSFAIHDVVLPEVEQQIRQQLMATSEQYVLKQCFNSFKRELLAPSCLSAAEPVLGLNLDSGTPVLVAVVGADDSRKKPVQVALLDESGQLCDEKVLLDLAYKNPETMSQQEQSMHQMDLEVLKSIIRKKKPKLIVLAANCSEAANLHDAVSNETFLTDCYGHIESKMVKTRYLKPVFQDLSRIPVSPESAMKSMNMLLRSAVSLGRQAQNPLAEILSTWDLVKQAKGLRLEHVLPLHPLQDLVSKKLLSLSLKQAAIESLNDVGLDLNRAFVFDHLSAMIKHVSGLGKHTADYLITMLKGTGELKRRVDLIDRKILQPLVYRNCSGFIKVVPRELRIKDSCDVLDTTRIHPDFYPTVRKLAVEALKAQGVEVPPTQDDNVTVEKAGRATGAEVSPLEKLLVGGAQNESSTMKGKLAAEVVKELKTPFKDPRGDEKPIDDEELAYALSSQSKQSLHEGKIVNVTVLRQEGLSYNCRMESGLEAVLDGREEVAGEVATFKEGEVVAARVVEIKAQEGKLKVTLSAKSKDLKCHDKWVKLRSQDRTWFYIDPRDLETSVSKPAPAAESQKTEAAPAPKAPKYLPREIHHKKFANVSLRKALDYLSGRDVGDYLFRPSSSGTEHLTLTLKFYKDSFVHIDIREECKAPGAPIGGKLIINEDSFGTLDDIINDYITPVMKRVKEITDDRKFVPNSSIDFLQNYIVVEHAKNPNVINYCFGIVPEYPQYVVLLVCPRQGKIINEYIKVKPQGYFFHDIYHKSVRDLVEWFKQNFASADYQRYLKRRNRAPTLQNQPCEHNELENKLETSPSQVMNTTYLPATEYQRPLESMTDANVAPSVYAGNGQFSVYKPPEITYRFENPADKSNSWGEDEKVSGKRPFGEKEWGNNNRGERRGRYDSDRFGGRSRSRSPSGGTFKEPYRMNFSRGRRDGGYGDRPPRRGGNGPAWQVSTDNDPWGTNKGAAESNPSWGNDSKPAGDTESNPWGSKPANDPWGTDSDAAKKPPTDSWDAPQSASGAEESRRDSHSGYRGFNTFEGSGSGWGGSDTSRDSGWGMDSRSRGGPRRGGGRGGRGCFNCGEEGHMSRDCPKRSERPRGDRGVCYNCGKPGHMSRDCTEERRPRGRGRGFGRGGDRGGDRGRGGWGGRSREGESGGRGSFGGWAVSSGWGESDAGQEKKNDSPGGWGEPAAETKPEEKKAEEAKTEEKKAEETKVDKAGEATEGRKDNEATMTEGRKDNETTVPEAASGDKGAEKDAEKDNNNPKVNEADKKAEEKAEHSGWT